MKDSWLIFSMGLLLLSCMQQKNEGRGGDADFTGQKGEVKLIVLAPGHFHANLLQKTAMPQVNDSVLVYASSSDETGLKQYLAAIEQSNNRSEDPTNWQLSVYAENDFLDKMITEAKGNVVLLAGNNREKTDYIQQAVDAGLNVLSDKPMAINKDDFFLLEKAYSTAESKDVLLYDMMTERYDMLNIIEKQLLNDTLFFGELVAGSMNEPAVYMESIHHFYKEVSGVPLQRPAWYYDVEQQGEGIADVTTHLIDLLFWKCFPEKVIDYRNDISNISAIHWPTKISFDQFVRSTGESSFPAYLQKYMKGDFLNVYANGTVHFKVKGHDVAMKVIWNYQAPAGGGDTFMGRMNGTKATLKTVQDKDHGFVKQLYVQAAEGVGEREFEINLKVAIEKIQHSYPFVSFSPSNQKGEYLINIPVESRDGHESHFRYVAESFFGFLVNRNMPEWETANTLAKYFITTEAVDVARERE